MGSLQAPHQPQISPWAISEPLAIVDILLLAPSLLVNSRGFQALASGLFYVGGPQVLQVLAVILGTYYSRPRVWLGPDSGGRPGADRGPTFVTGVRRPCPGL